MHAVDGHAPLTTEVTLEACIGVRRNDRHEQRAILDLLPDLLIPCVAADEFALVEPYLDAACAQRFSDALRRLGILRSI